MTTYLGHWSSFGIAGVSAHEVVSKCCFGRVEAAADTDYYDGNRCISVVGGVGTSGSFGWRGRDIGCLATKSWFRQRSH